ncbi:MAG TPA: signal recognition particle-docking protein FtsY [Acidimicrobiales bacterium]|nr:signal recognition particle-docking protein FtsY [Acidimicrobiales bacterium]
MDLVVVVAVLALVLVAGSAYFLVVGRRRDESLGVEEPSTAEVEAPAAATAAATATVEAPAGPPPTFRDRLGKARGALGGYLTTIRSRKVDDQTWDDLEEALIRADVGVAATQRILDDLREVAKSESISDPDALIDRLKAELKGLLSEGDRSLRYDAGSPNVWLFVGVNGVGKTTTIGKIARQQIAGGRSVVMAAGDTFRAAAAEQLTAWAERSGADIVRGNEGGDPSAVIYDAVQRAAARGGDLVLGDTAGRLHTKTNLMEELSKVRRVADREPGSVTEVLLVLDATTGQNGLTQAQQFTDAVDVTGIVLTKLDGSAKGGIALAVETSLGIPIKLVGLGEGVEDLVDFDPDEFVEALFA